MLTLNNCSDITDNSPAQKLKSLFDRFSKSDLNAFEALTALSGLLDTSKEQWPVFDLIHYFQRVWHSLPEETKSKNYHESQEIVKKVEGQVKASYSSIADFILADANTPAIIDGQNPRRVLSHRVIHDFTRSFDLRLSVLNNARPRVVVALPNGPTMGLACIAVATHYTLVPLIPSVGAEQFRADVERVQATAIIVLAADAQKLKLDEAAWIKAARISIFAAKPQDDMTFDLEPITNRLVHYTCGEIPLTAQNPNKADDISMILFTSGTSGTKKLVPITTHSMIAGVAFVIDSWNLKVSDCCLNMMPLHHM